MQCNLSELATRLTKETGVLPAIKLKHEMDLLPYVRRMYEGGARVVEITTTTPGAFEQYRSISREFGRDLLVAAGTVLDATTARTAILAGAGIIVSPAVIPEVIQTANRYGVACYAGAFTATECLTAMEAGATMVKVFPAALAGPAYMTNLRMVYPDLNLIPSGGVSLENAGEFIRRGACAISGARNFFDLSSVEQHGRSWITEQVGKYIEIVRRAKEDAPELP